VGGAHTPTGRSGVRELHTVDWRDAGFPSVARARESADRRRAGDHRMRRWLLILLSCSFSHCTDLPRHEPETACNPPVRKTYTLEESIPLKCNGSGARATSQKVFDVLVHERGFALARARLRMRHTGASDITHFWNAHVAVGRCSSSRYPRWMVPRFDGQMWGIEGGEDHGVWVGDSCCSE